MRTSPPGGQAPNQADDGGGALLLAADARGGGACLQALGPGRYRLRGNLDLAGVAALARAGRLLAPGPSAGPIEVDLSAVGRSSSAAVALLLEWSEQVRARAGELRYTGWPEALVRIAGLSNVDGLLGCGPEHHPDQ